MGQVRGRELYVLGALGRFGDDRGLGPVPVLMAEVVEAFCVSGLDGRASSTRGTYRSVLRRLGGLPRPALAPAFPASPAAAPYTRSERAALFSVARSQRSAWRRGSALALLALGIGAGLRAGEVVAARGEDITAVPGGARVQVRGRAARLVTVSQEPYVAALLERAAAQPEDHLFCPGNAERAYKNFVNNFARALEADPAAPELCSGRARASFICDHLAAGTPLGELADLAGIKQVESLLRYARHVAGAPRLKAELRAALRGQ